MSQERQRARSRERDARTTTSDRRQLEPVVGGIGIEYSHRPSRGVVMPAAAAPPITPISRARNIFAAAHLPGVLLAREITLMPTHTHTHTHNAHHAHRPSVSNNALLGKAPEEFSDGLTPPGCGGKRHSLTGKSKRDWRHETGLAVRAA